MESEKREDSLFTVIVVDDNDYYHYYYHDYKATRCLDEKNATILLEIRKEKNFVLNVSNKLIPRIGLVFEYLARFITQKIFAIVILKPLQTITTRT